MRIFLEDIGMALSYGILFFLSLIFLYVTFRLVAKAIFTSYFEARAKDKAEKEIEDGEKKSIRSKINEGSTQKKDAGFTG